LTLPQEGYLWSVDSLNINGHTVYVSGWFFCAVKKCTGISLELVSSTNELLGSIQLNAGNPRQDVLMIHPSQQHALHSGFTGLGGWSATPSSTDQLRLRCVLDDGSELLLDIPEKHWRIPS
jgi:hypothetical protein